MTQARGTATTERGRILEALAEAHERTRRAVAGLPDHDLHTAWQDGWSTKDLLAHVSSWDELAALDLERLRAGHVPFLSAWNAEVVDSWNAFLMSGRKAFTTPQVRAEFEGRRQALLDALAQMPDESFAEGQIVRRVADVLAQHEHAHAEAIEAWRASSGA